jgi:lysophospholipase L1-like esterase
MEGAGDSRGGFFQRLQDKYSPEGLVLVNEGRGGETVYQMLKRAVKLDPAREFDIVVLLGCNDVPRANDPTPEVRSEKDDYARYLASLFYYLKGRRSLFITSFLVSEPLTGISPTLFGEYAGLARSLAYSSHFDICDLYAETKENVSQYWAEDGLHFNDAGHALIAEKVAAWYETK